MFPLREGVSYLCHKNVLVSSPKVLVFLRATAGIHRDSVHFTIQNQSAKQGKLLKKIMSGSKKKWYYDPSTWMEKPRLDGSDFLRPKVARNPRRVAVLNSVLLQYVTDLMSTGEISNEFLGLGVEITRVKVSEDFTSVNVYWLSSKASDSDEVRLVLQRNAGKLRSQLCSLNVLGNVPHINFVKDKYQEQVNEVEQRLARADFGPDFVPTDPAHHAKSSIILHRSIPNLSDLDEMEPSTHPGSDSPNGGEVGCIADPSSVNNNMRMDILGLNHREMSKQVLQNMHHVKQSESEEAGDNDGQSGAVMDFNQYLQQQKRLKRLGRKQTLVTLQNMELTSDKHLHNDNAEEEMHHEEDDYFDEEDVLHHGMNSDVPPPVQ